MPCLGGREGAYWCAFNEVQVSLQKFTEYIDWVWKCFLRGLVDSRWLSFQQPHCRNWIQCLRCSFVSDVLCCSSLLCVWVRIPTRGSQVWLLIWFCNSCYCTNKKLASQVWGILTFSSELQVFLYEVRKFKYFTINKPLKTHRMI